MKVPGDVTDKNVELTIPDATQLSHHRLPNQGLRHFPKVEQLNIDKTTK